MGITSRITNRFAPKAVDIAPGPASAVIHRALAQAIAGVGPLKGAAAAADAQLAEQHGTGPREVEAAVKDLISNHVRFAGAQGFATNLGGLVTLAATIPANLAGLALLQCRMVAGIAHLHGYDLADPRVHNAILACILGEGDVRQLVKSGKLPGTPRQIATVHEHSEELDRAVSRQVAAALISGVAGRRLVTTVGKRVPVAGGLVGAGSDAHSTWQVGKYAAKELRPRQRG
ncbi:MAG: EcsC protein family protein [Marmoricola sp.]|jgi:uncharacterized protein (DUF697 family)|nr:EcsC protein family protein [Marmoricola sp.]